MTKPETVDAIRNVIKCAESMKGAYFFTPPGNAPGRRAYERKFSAPLVTWNEGGDEFAAEFVTTCSCANVYARGHYTRNGTKTTLTAIRNSLARLERNA